MSSSSAAAPDWLLSASFWLPENVTVDEALLERPPWPPVADLYFCLPLVVGCLLVQVLLQRLFLKPIAALHGIKIKEQIPSVNDRLENIFRQRWKSPSDYKMIKKLAEELNWAERQVERWFRMRERMQKGGKFKKFKECGWRFTFYGFISIFGCIVLWDKTWLWDLDECWSNYLNFKVPREIWWYYLLEISFYVYLMMSQFTDVIRKDFWEMMIHHISTIILIAFSYLTNNARFGSLVLLCHDLADIPLELGKMSKYLKRETLCNCCFAVFLLLWFPTRLGIFPFVLIKSCLNNSHRTLGTVRYILNSLLIVLFVLHIIWSWMICKVVHRALFKGELDDVRSDSDDCSSDSIRKKPN